MAAPKKASKKPPSKVAHASVVAERMAAALANRHEPESPELWSAVRERCLSEFRKSVGREWPDTGFATDYGLESRAREAWAKLRGALKDALEVVIDGDEARFGPPERDGVAAGGQALIYLDHLVTRISSTGVLPGLGLDRRTGDVQEAARKRLRAAQKELEAARDALDADDPHSRVRLGQAEQAHRHAEQELRSYTVAWSLPATSRAWLAHTLDTKDLYGTRRRLTAREMALVSLLSGNRPSLPDAGRYTVAEVIRAEAKAMREALRDYGWTREHDDEGNPIDPVKLPRGPGH